ncbi:MAG: DUF5615 family PIN-like protein [Planctomycetes bacterium]|nr:DUF5615 family PIN-like protein [Planctomycetota bacterium]
MNLYLDDDSVDGVLLRLLRRAGHDVQLPQNAGMLGESDPVHLTFASRSQRVLLSRNHDDFRELHELVYYTGGAHSGILIVRYDNDTRRDLSQKGIVVAIANLIAANIPIQNEFIVLNDWRQSPTPASRAVLGPGSALRAYPFEHEKPGVGLATSLPGLLLRGL